ncbi:sialate O-acetylesterase [Flavitalea sp. BT771]|uniref:sialate O-acetylesterase n=1 Tax=Flavitalea sp. BT771 TaxID=3063329 RepID=UPI0026E43321|nr:sialate O-acetylesterase [Flavitalea sp. BT771]MDO6431506.1 sialate O-acetylesterase [Flavitalea sp. BT771]MDV6220414.1 sialate O-acetylesterase [Flavitalea sp. BT771]
MRSIFFLLLLIISLHAFSEISLPSIIASNMVLQQRTDAPLWGKATARSRVSVTTSWDHKTYAFMAGADGSWKVMVKTPAAGGPYKIILSDGKATILDNILIGEVWLCSGQSNMEMPVKGFKNQPILGSTQLLMDAGNPQIRLFRLERALSRTPQSDCKATSWQKADAANIADFSAVGYQYAKILQEKLKVPVGVIMSAWGGTVIEAWMDQAGLKNFPNIKTFAATDTTKITKNEPTVLYNAMIQPLTDYGIKGVIWYQGEQNRSNPEIYDSLLSTMVREWRQLWNRGDWPFYYVQIAPYGYNDKLGPAAPLREAQLKAMARIPHAGMVVSMDAGEQRSIHPADKAVISQRLACWALADTYGRTGIPYASPTYHGMKVERDGIAVSFDHALNGLTSFGKSLAAFEVAGEDKVFHPANAKITGNGVTVWSDSVRMPVAVRYAYKDWVVGDLYNTEGLPAAPFRTDDWPPAAVK